MSYVLTSFERIRELCKDDVATLIVKDKDYGSSWRKRGGIGAFMMLARKWDRIETQCEAKGYDIFQAAVDPTGILDDISDLRCYLLLVEEHIIANTKE